MTARPRATPPADRVERPGEAGPIILDRASCPRRGTRALDTIRAIGATALLRPPRLRIALARATDRWLRPREAATAPSARQGTLGKRSAGQALALRQAFL